MWPCPITPARPWKFRAGSTTIGAETFEVIDSPGIHSLIAQSDEERATRSFLLTRPDLVIQVGSAMHLDLALMLTLELAELEIPMVLCLNMKDEAVEPRDLGRYGVLVQSPGHSRRRDDRHDAGRAPGSAEGGRPRGGSPCQAAIRPKSRPSSGLQPGRSARPISRSFRCSCRTICRRTKSPPPGFIFRRKLWSRLKEAQKEFCPAAFPRLHGGAPGAGQGAHRRDPPPCREIQRAEGHGWTSPGSGVCGPGRVSRSRSLALWMLYEFVAVFGAQWAVDFMQNTGFRPVDQSGR